MRILIISGSYPPHRCGVGDYTFHLARALALLPETQVAVLTTATHGDLNNDNNVSVFRTIKSWSFRDIATVKKHITEWLPDLIHIQYPTQGYGRTLLPWLLPIYLSATRQKVVQTWHEPFGVWPRPIMLFKTLGSKDIIVVRPNFWVLLPSLLRPLKKMKHWKYIRSAPSIRASSLDENERNKLRNIYVPNNRRLIVFFGFIYPNKGVERLFEIADPATDNILIIGEMDEKRDYCRELRRLAAQNTWRDNVSFTGFIPDDDVADLLAISDAAVLPFPEGGGEWNSSINAAAVNGAFILTTSFSENGYKKNANIYYAAPHNINEMKLALKKYSGGEYQCTYIFDEEWRRVAIEHCSFYNKILKQ